MDLKQKLSKIRILLTDVDGVLTDGGVYYSLDGIMLLKFNVKDGMGTLLLKDAGIMTGIITSATNGIGKVRGDLLKFNYVYAGVTDKTVVLEEILSKTGLTPDQAAFIGDDVNDGEILKKVGFSASPADAHPDIKTLVDYVCSAEGGKGVYREVGDMILKARISV